MTTDYQVVSKILIYDDDSHTLDSLKLFCKVHNLIGLRSNSASLDELLAKNLDLGGIFVAEQTDERGYSGIKIAEKIHSLRPELPIFLRRESSNTLEGLPDQQQKMFAGAYVKNNLSQLLALIDQYIFDVYYPSSLIKVIKAASEHVLDKHFSNVEVEFDKPYLVKDQIIFGELLSLIPLESNWCRGYMMMQINEGDMTLLRNKGNIHSSHRSGDFRELTEWLGETTNLIWGALKNRFLISNPPDNLAFKAQVPIIMDLARRYISFGTDMPHLVLKYTLKDPERKLSDIYIYQKFIFHLHWCPENMKNDSSALNDCVEAGVVDFF